MSKTPITMQYLEEDFYKHIKTTLTQARHKVYHAANFTMIQAYHEIGRSIVEKQGVMREANMEKVC